MRDDDPCPEIIIRVSIGTACERLINAGQVYEPSQAESISMKDPKDQRAIRSQGTGDFQEPPQKGASGEQSDTANWDEEAPTDEFEAPREAPFSEDVSSVQPESMPGGISRNLVDIKVQIENAIRQNAINGTILAERASQ